MVFGFSNLLQFSLFATPVLMLPAAVFAFWRARIAAVCCWLLFLLFVWGHAVMTWPKLTEVVIGPIHFVPVFLSVLLLTVAARTGKDEGKAISVPV